ncbi:MAG: ABC transporter permease [Anaerolinea sp. 4484_236]|nr:MAG: ABC transporter permease [Anaerolinea sp. 4484_236]RLD08700.1 MAG: sugar ABC transporter permease [Chloroflexota bacterium]
MINSKKLKTLLGKATPYFLILPVVLYYAAFWLRPVIVSVIGGFTDTLGNFTLQNFLMVFNDKAFIPAIRNTAILVIFSVTLEFIVALFLALIINRKFVGSGIFLFLAMIPMALPAAAAGAMWITGLTAHGWINSLLSYLGILAQGDKIYWLAGSEYSLLALLIFIDAWQVIPSVMIILLAGLQNIPEETREAGFVFGGDFLTVLRKITIPMLKSTIQTAVILRLISAIQIWLIVVFLLGFSRMPVLVERIVFYHKEVRGLDISYQMATGYTIIVSVIVSLAALAYLQVSGAFKKDVEETA